MTVAAQRSVAFADLGCKLNQFETESIATQLQEKGYRIVEFDEPADAYVVNTCTVTNRADRKSRNLFNRARRAAAAAHAAAEPLAAAPLVVLTGCFVNSHRDELESDGRTYIIANEQKQSIPALVDAHFRGEVVHPAGDVFDFPVPTRIFHTRSTVKVQDGCDNFCTFCIIPAVRGRAVSRSSRDVVAAVAEAVAAGAREVVLTGVNMSRYRDGRIDFTGLVEACLDLPGQSEASDYRLRISSLEPDGLADRFIRLFEHPRMAPHLHLCLQSGSQRMLLAMRRQYTYDEYRRLAAELRSIDPRFNITTDLLVGFPSEEDDDHAASLAAIEEIGFGHVHTFPYSPRHGTRAERLPGQVPSRVKTERSAAARSAAEAAKRRYRESLVGTRERLLVERAERRDGAIVLRGFGQHYVPIEARLRPADATIAPQSYENTFVETCIESIGEGDDPVLHGSPR